jgi:formamidopyrimidine-DNA glycosylase
MPELPEVETVARGLDEQLSGCTVTGADVHWERSIGAPDPVTFAEHLVGQTVTGVGRRGKWIVIQLDSGHTLLVHLRMTGQLLLEPAGSPDGDYTRVVLHLDDERRLRFSDMRKFGRLILTKDISDVLGDLGPEPLGDDFTVERFQEMLAQHRGRIKSLLLDQRFLAGLGNIYVNEALWQARIHPLRPANSLSPAETRRLYDAIRAVLRAAIKEGGTTLDNGNFRQTNGEAGEFGSRLQIYDREGEPCECCGAPIERITVGQRGTYFCPCCQEAEPSETGDPTEAGGPPQVG